MEWQHCSRQGDGTLRTNVRPKGFACQMVSYGFVWVDDARWVVTGRYWLQNWNWSAVDYWKWLKTLTLGIASPAGRWFHGNDGAISGDLTRRFWPWPAIVVAPGVPSCWTFWRKATMGDWWLKLDCDDEDFISKTPMTMSWLYICIYNYIYIWMYIIIHIYIHILMVLFLYPKKSCLPWDSDHLRPLDGRTHEQHWTTNYVKHCEGIVISIFFAVPARDVSTSACQHALGWRGGQRDYCSSQGQQKWYEITRQGNWSQMLFNSFV